MSGSSSSPPSTTRSSKTSSLPTLLSLTSAPAPTAPTLVATSSAPALPTTSDPTSQPFNASASLYLYTFLATLVLLLGISSAIVVRSLLVRRQHRRMIDEAIRNGTWVPSATSRGRHVATKKPRMFETWFPKGDGGESGVDGQGSSGSGQGKMITHPKEEQEWDGIMPFSATYIDPSAPNSTSLLSPSAPAPRPSSTRSTSTFNSLSYLWRRPPRPFTTPASASTSTSTSTAVPPPNPNAPATTPDPTNPATLRVAFLIAMPSQAPAHAESAQHDEEPELPHIEFGVAEVGVAPRERDGGKESVDVEEGKGEMGA